MELYAYQQRAVAALLESLSRGRALLVQPTGSGKTVVGAEMVRREPGRSLWLAHRRELITQAVDALHRSGVRDVGALSAGKRDASARVIVASIDTLRRRDIPAADFIVIDEAHRAPARGYQMVLDALPGARVLGLTATPHRLDGKGLDGTFAEMVIGAQPIELIAEKRIVAPVVYALVSASESAAMVSGIRTVTGDYSPAHLGRAMMAGPHMDNLVRDCARVAPRAQTIVFAASREHGRALTERFIAAGRRARFLDGETPEAEREEITDGLASGAVEVAVNVDVLTEGFDCAAVSCVVMARPTKSVTRYLQYAGRVARPRHRKRAVILDHAGNVYRHRLPHIDREWHLDGRPPTCGDAPIKACGECGAAMRIDMMTCPECGAAQVPDAREIEARETALAQVQATERERECIRAAVAEVASRNGYGGAWAEVVMADLAGAA